MRLVTLFCLCVTTHAAVLGIAQAEPKSAQGKAKGGAPCAVNSPASAACHSFVQERRAPASVVAVGMETDHEDFPAPADADEAAELARPAGSIMNIEAP